MRRLLKRAEIEGRSDDSEETVRKRMKVYQAQTEPLIAHYVGAGDRARGGRRWASVDEVAKRIEEALA